MSLTIQERHELLSRVSQNLEEEFYGMYHHSGTLSKLNIEFIKDSIEKLQLVIQDYPLEY